MQRIFVDTGAYIALADRSDQHHVAATDLARSIHASRLRTCTTTYVFAETVTWLRRKLGHAAALRYGTLIRRQHARNQMDLFSPDLMTEDAAWEIFAAYTDQSFSYVDCTSFAWLKQQKAIPVFAFDEHFRWMGFHLYGATS